MTEKEKNALRKAFCFEDPDRKDEFAQQFARLESSKMKKTIFPFIIKFAAAAAMMTVVVGTAVMMPKDIDHFGSDSIVTEPVEETASVNTSEKAETMTVPKTTVKSAAASTTPVSAAKTTAAAVKTTEKDPAATAVTSQQTGNITTVKAETVQTATKAEEQHEKEESSPGIRYRDLTISVDKSYPMRHKVISEEEYSKSASKKPEIIDEDSSDGSFQPKDAVENGINIDISEMYNDSSYVVLANLGEIVYTSIGGEAFTAENITVSKVYKGDIQVNDRITVFFKGGFLPAEKYSELRCFPPIADQEEYSVEITGESGGRQIQGRSYIFFLRDGGEAVPDGAYEPSTMGNMSVFELQDGLYRAVGNEKLIFTVSQAENGF